MAWNEVRMRRKRRQREKPPCLAAWILSRLIENDIREGAVGELEEIYRSIERSDGRSAALRWYWMQVLGLIRDWTGYLIKGEAGMLSNYLRTALRHLSKHSAYTFINLIGLTVGMTCCYLILLWVRMEIRYDRFHRNHDRIYRVTRPYTNEDGTRRYHFGAVAYDMAPLLLNEFPEIEAAVRLMRIDEVLIRVGDNRLNEQGLFFAEESIFDVFTFDMTAGNPRTALDGPNRIVLTDRMANKFFGYDDPMGKTLACSIDDVTLVLEVSGIVRLWPQESHFHPEFLVSLDTFEALVPEGSPSRNWANNQYWTYLLMPEGYDVSSLEDRLDVFLDKHRPASFMGKTRLRLQKLIKIHLHSHLDSELETNGNATSVIIFSLTGLLVLLIACFNFINLSTARSASRRREIGLRKVVGAEKRQLVSQFLSESVLLALLASGFAVLLTMLFLPIMSRFTDQELTWHPFQDPDVLWVFVGLAILVGVGAGVYPALFLSQFQPRQILSGRGHRAFKRVSLRTMLVIVQFSISMSIAISLGLITEQLQYMTDIDLGYDKDQVVVLPSSSFIAQNLGAVKETLLSHPGILSVCASKTVPSERLRDSSIISTISGSTGEPVELPMTTVKVDHDYLDTYNVDLVAGRNFSQSIVTDASSAYILNEAAVRLLGWETPWDAVGKSFGMSWRTGTIIGVIRDVHFESLHHEVKPFLMMVWPYEWAQVSVRIRPEAIRSTLSYLETMWKEYRPEHPFTYTFVDDRFDRLYQSEMQLQRIFRSFASLAVFVACLGLFGLVSFTAEQRTREIGIRKILGASEAGIVGMFSKEIVLWMMIANIIAWPVTYLFMREWLEGFAYHTTIQIGTFILSGLVTLGIALLTVSYQAIRAAHKDPVETLKYE